MTSVDQILSEYIDAWNAGRRPDADDYIARASPHERDALAGALSEFLTWAPEPAYPAATLDAVRVDPRLERARALVADEPLPTLLARLRARASLSRGELAARVLGSLGLSGKEEKAERYLESLEAGSLDPSRLSSRLLDALSTALGIGREQLERAARALPPVMPAVAPAQAKPAFQWRALEHRRETVADDLEILASAAEVRLPEPMDEIDELFRGGR